MHRCADAGGSTDEKQLEDVVQWKCDVHGAMIDSVRM